MISWLLPRRPLRALFLLTLLLCAAYLFAAHHAGRAELRALCESGVEPTIYSRVSAGGYFDGGISCLRNGCWDVLTGSGYRYIEVEQRDADAGDFLPQNGYYRISKVLRDSLQCDEQALRDMERSVGDREFLAGGQCLAIEKIEAVSAPFGIFSERLPTVELNNLFGSVIAARWFYIKDMRTDQLVAEQTSYMLFQNSLPSFSSFEAWCIVVGQLDLAVAKSDISERGVLFET
jgi:hypothetical protein